MLRDLKKSNSMSQMGEGSRNQIRNLICNNQQYKVQLRLNSPSSTNKNNSSLLNEANFSTRSYSNSKQQPLKGSGVQTKPYAVQLEEKAQGLTAEIHRLQEELQRQKSSFERRVEDNCAQIKNAYQKNLVRSKELEERNLFLEKEYAQSSEKYEKLQRQYRELEAMFEDERRRLVSERDDLNQKLIDLENNQESINKVYYQESVAQGNIITDLQVSARYRAGRRLSKQESATRESLTRATRGAK